MILKIGFTLSKKLPLHRAYVKGGSIFFFTAVRSLSNGLNYRYFHDLINRYFPYVKKGLACPIGPLCL